VVIATFAISGLSIIGSAYSIVITYRSNKRRRRVQASYRRMPPP
jgi:hypothetical protein